MYVPAAHCIQPVAPRPLPYEPAGHSAHADAPAAAEYVPAAHCMQPIAPASE